MADYFDEMSWTPLGDNETPDFFLQVARLLRDTGLLHLNQEYESLPPPASKEAVKNLKEVKIDSKSDKLEKCPVCLKDYESGAVVKSLPCNHSFHTECIGPWLEKTNSCPVCRYELPTDNEDYEAYKKEKKRAVEREKDLEALHNSMFS